MSGNSASLWLQGWEELKVFFCSPKTYDLEKVNQNLPNGGLARVEVLPPSICLAPLRPLARPCIFDASISCSQNPICPKDVIERTRFCTNPHLIYPFLFPLASLICFSPLWVPLTIWSHDKAPARSPVKKNWCCWEPLKAHGVLGAFFGPFILGFYKIDPIQVLKNKSSFAMLDWR